MANKKRLIDVNKVIDQMQKCIDEPTYERDSIASYTFGAIIECLKQEPPVDAVELPKGKPGDYLEWDNGTGFKQIYCIYAVMICEDCVRYDLEKFSPEVNHKNIVRIMSKEQAVKEYRDRCTRERTEEEPTFTAVKGESKGE